MQDSPADVANDTSDANTTLLSMEQRGSTDATTKGPDKSEGSSSTEQRDPATDNLNYGAKTSISRSPQGDPIANVTSNGPAAETTRSQFSPGTWTLSLFTGAALTVTIVYAWAVSMKPGPITKIVPSGETISLNVLRICSEVTGILLVALWTSVLEVILWVNAGSTNGMTMTSLLEISPTTRIMGLLHLLLWNGKSLHRLWVVKRYAPVLRNRLTR